MALWLLIGCLGCNLLASGPGTLDESTRAEYQQRKTAAKLDPDSQVALALWCEQNGLTAERNRHLALAALRDPNNPRIRSLMGQVQDGEGWKRVDETQPEKPAANPIVDEYRTRRDEIQDTDDDHEKLADWCTRNGLLDEADAHLRAALRINPNRTSVWKKLGYRRLNGRWVNDEILDAEKAEAEAQKQANNDWKDRITQLLKDLRGRDRSRSAAAQAELDAIHDPRALPTLWKLVVLGKNGDPELGVRLIAHLDSPEASQLLAILAIEHNADRVRNQAAQALRCRDPREFAGLLIEQIGTPLQYEVRPVGGPGSPGVLFINGEQAYLRRTYAPPPIAGPESGLTLVNGFDGAPALLTPIEIGRLTQPRFAPISSAPGERWRMNSPVSQGDWDRAQKDLALFQRAQQRTQLLILESMKTAQVAQAQLANDVAQINQFNEQTRVFNKRIFQVLGPFARIDQDAGRDPWRSWYQDLIGYRYDPPRRKYPGDKPVIDQRIPVAYQPMIPFDLRYNPEKGYLGHAACFAPGTPVHTRDGLVPIEQLRIGDQVLSIDTRTGKLGYRSVITVLHNPPSETLKIQAGGETVTATLIHRFWKAGEGWSLARDLAIGDPIRGIRGVHPIESIESGKTMPVFNLEIADNGTFFVGQTGWLVRDHTLPNLRDLPYDAQPQKPNPADTVAQR